MMANPLYQMLMGQNRMPQPTYSGMQFQNPLQKMQYIMQAMTNPAAFVRQQFPDMPAEISNNPNQILNWMQQTKGVSNMDIQQAQQQRDQILGQGTVR